MRRILILFIAVAAVLSAAAQNRTRPRFSPERFQAELEQFIAKEACLTPKESAAFFPEYREMTKKQRVIFDRMRKLGRNKPADEAGCLNVIKQRDNLDVELKKLQQTYHNKFLSVISASKLFDVIKAEEHFHRHMLKNASGKSDKPAQDKPGK